MLGRRDVVPRKQRRQEIVGKLRQTKNGAVLTDSDYHTNVQRKQFKQQLLAES